MALHTLSHDQQLCTQPHVENVLTSTPTHEAVIELDPSCLYNFVHTLPLQELNPVTCEPANVHGFLSDNERSYVFML